MKHLLFALLAAGSVAACTDDGAPVPASVAEVGAIEVFTNYRGDTATAFRAVLDRFEESTGFEVLHVGTADLAFRIQERIDESDPPDIALLPQPGLIRELANEGAAMAVETVSPLLRELVADNFDDLVPTVSVDGQVYGVPWRVDVSSLIWYRPDVFEEWQYTVPESMDQLQELVGRMESDGFAPWCIGIESFEATGWVGTDWVEDLVIRQQGLDYYDRWAAGDVSFDDPGVRRAFTTWDEIALSPGLHFGTTRTILNTPWAQAADPMLEPAPGCLLHRQTGSWSQELPDGLVIGEDVDLFPVPPGEEGAVDPIILNGEFATALTSRPGVAELMSFLLDIDSGAIWAQQGGYVSPHPDFDPANYTNDFDRRLHDFIQSADAVRFDGSDTMPPSVGTGSFWEGIVQYVGTRDLDLAVAVIDFGARDPGDE